MTDLTRPAPRPRMTGPQRREQLLDVGKRTFAEKGYEATTIEEIAQRAGVSKPVVYEHFGSKEGLYALVVDRESQRLLSSIVEALTARHPRAALGRTADALLEYIEEEADGFQLLVRDSPFTSSTGLASLIGDIAPRVEHILADEFRARGYDPKLAPMYSRALVGMIALVGEWWLDTRRPNRRLVADHLVNLAWNGLGNLERKPRPIARLDSRKR